MSRYIDADELVRYMEERQERLKDDESLWELSVVETFLGRASSADVVRARHAEWQLIHRDKDFYKDVYQCSECRFLVADTLEIAYAYCPNCGAKMDGKNQSDKEYEDSILAAQKSEE